MYHIKYYTSTPIWCPSCICYVCVQVEAYWCFWHYMEHIKADFVEDGVLNKLSKAYNYYNTYFILCLKVITY